MGFSLTRLGEDAGIGRDSYAPSVKGIEPPTRISSGYTDSSTYRLEASSVRGGRGYDTRYTRSDSIFDSLKTGDYSSGSGGKVGFAGIGVGFGDGFTGTGNLSGVEGGISGTSSGSISN